MGNYSDMQPEDALSLWSGEETQKPHESLDQKYWKKIFLALCLCAVLIDPLFLYIPILKDDFKCLMLDPKLKIRVLLSRSVIDFFYLMDIIIRIYRSENYSSLNNEPNRRQHQMKFNFVLKFCVPRIAKTIWASNDILIDIVALLPLPQVAILIFFSKMSDLRSLTTTRMVFMNMFALLQYIPRVFRIYLSSMELKKTHEEEISETPIWIKGVLNFCMYIIASHVVGALWYFFAIQRMMMCWHSACLKNDGCDNRFFGCHDHHAFRNTTILNDLCSVSDNSSDTMLFSFGIFATVLQYGVVGSTNYFQKFLNYFWWGLRNLSSLGSNLEPSVDGWENLYTVFISITGLLLFLYLIGNLQVCLKNFSYTYH
ncbi:cyclic nucleotide-gated ion channel 1 [Pyrus x bretschneideri]|uniref:cyclic nucleotide-gated ion channel 1 n=1 Tax=Pyrus x bretschneideri TaxID=225117 RepID=UPI00202F9DB5|nr:cyclic nucleotide-gated ion channel 1 [Pyrus x bretschneideri]